MIGNIQNFRPNSNLVKLLFITWLSVWSVLCLAQGSTMNGTIGLIPTSASIGGVSDSSCMHEGTRGNIISLRNSSSLTPGCFYKITDYNRGTVGAVNIILLATSANQLTLHAYVETGFDNIAWHGEYDIDANRIIALEDNWNNYAENQAAVDRFPWGSSRVRNVRVLDDANWSVGTPNATYYDMELKGNAVLTTTGMTGYIYRSTFYGAANSNYANSNVNIYESEFGGNFSCDCDNAASYQSLRSEHFSSAHDYNSGARLTFDRFNTYALSNIRNDGGTMLMYYGSSTSGYIRVAAGLFYSYYTTYTSYHYSYKTNDALHYDYMSSLSDRSYRYIYNGTRASYFYYGSMRSYTYQYINNSFLYSIGNDFSSRAYLRYNNCNRVNSYYNSYSNYGRCNFNNVTGTVSENYNKLTGGSYLYVNASANPRVYYNELSGSSQMYVQNAATITVQRCNLTTGSRQYYQNGSSHYGNYTMGASTLNAYNATSVYNSGVIGPVSKTLGTGTFANKIAITGGVIDNY